MGRQDSEGEHHPQMWVSFHPFTPSVLFLVLCFVSGHQPCPDPPSSPLPFWNTPRPPSLACQHPHPPGWPLLLLTGLAWITDAQMQGF